MALHKFPATRKPAAKNTAYRMIAKGERAEIYLYGVVGGDWFGDGVTAKQFADDLKALGSVSTIDLRINSEGGDVFAGKAMYTLLVEHKAKVISHIDGLAASAASFIAMAGNEIEIAEGAFMMIHNAWTFALGNAEELRRSANLLDTVDASMVDVYAGRTKQSAGDIKKWMAEETWWTGKQCVEKGFADRVVENLKVAASVSDPKRYRNLPTALQPNRVAASRAIAAMAQTIGSKK